MTMAFFTEPPYLQKTILSDLQGAWEVLLEEVLEQHPFPESERLLFHIREGMSWESVRNLQYMQNIIVLIKNISVKNHAPESILTEIESVRVLVNEAIRLES